MHEKRAKVSIIIKTLNEEENIERCLKSAVAVAATCDGVVVVADSGSSDQTIEIAQSYPVMIVQLEDWNERSCGVGAQLGYQHILADYYYILDGDMEILPEFIAAAVSRFEESPTTAGIAGLVDERGGGNYEFEQRIKKQDGNIVGYQGFLDMGGLYRGAALSQVGYFTNRNLHAFEEKELGLRLQNAGFKLERINCTSVRHYGKTDRSFALIMRRFKGKFLDAPGEWLASTRSVKEFIQVLRYFPNVLVFIALYVISILSLLAVSWQPLALLVPTVLFAGVFIAQCIRKRSVMNGLYSFLYLNLFAIGSIRGFLRPRKEPGDPIRSTVIKGA